MIENHDVVLAINSLKTYSAPGVNQLGFVTGGEELAKEVLQGPIRVGKDRRNGNITEWTVLKVSEAVRSAEDRKG